jgi:Zn-dependent protease with chaperone function
MTPFDRVWKSREGYGLVRGPTRSGLARPFMSHPPVEERIDTLRLLSG